MTQLKLIFGDCFAELEKLPDESVDLVVTDPPYGIGYCSQHSKDPKYRERVADTTGWDDFDLSKFPMRELQRITKKTGAIYVFSRWDVFNLLPKPKQLLIWNKTGGGQFGMGDLRYYGMSYEVICFYPMAEHCLNQRRPSVLHARGIGDFTNGNPQDLILHPTQKPEEIIAPLIQNSSKRGDVILDPFMGSGTTGVCALKLGRSFLGIEIAEHYFKIAEKRISPLLEQARINDFFQS